MRFILYQNVNVQSDNIFQTQNSNCPAERGQNTHDQGERGKIPLLPNKVRKKEREKGHNS